MKRIFMISKDLLTDSAPGPEEDVLQLRLERFYHPGKDKQVLFITNSNKVIMEVLQYAESHRSWFIGKEISSDGKIYMSTPIDTTFLALYHLRKQCSQKAMSLDNILDSDDPSLGRLMEHFVDPKALRCIADVRQHDEVQYFKYNHQKTLAWLSLKTERVAKCLRERNIYCGRAGVSASYVQSEKFIEESSRETHEDFLRMACDYVGSYISHDLHENLIEYLQLPVEKPTVNSKKRKSVTTSDNDNQKKIKLEVDDDDDFRPENSYPTPFIESTVQQERTLTTKEKTLAKAAKGSKSIMGFFQKKSAK